MKSTSIKETVNTAMITAGNTCKKRPLSPGTKKSGRKAMMLVLTANTTGTVISLTPATAASMRDIPCDIL